MYYSRKFKVSKTTKHITVVYFLRARKRCMTWSLCRKKRLCPGKCFWTETYKLFRRFKTKARIIWNRSKSTNLSEQNVTTDWFITIDTEVFIIDIYMINTVKICFVIPLFTVLSNLYSVIIRKTATQYTNFILSR